MKTGNVSQGRVFHPQTRSPHEDKTAERKQGPTLEEKVDLSTKGARVVPGVTTSYDDVLDLLYGIDFSRFKDVEWMSRDGSSKLMELLQT